MSVAVFLSGRIVTPYYEDSVIKMRYTLAEFDPIFFISVNSNAHDEVYMRRLINDLKIIEENVNVEETVEPEELREYEKKRESDYHRTYSMFYHNKKCFMMMEKYRKKYNVEFDLVLKYRTDIDNTCGLDIYELQPDTVYIPEGFDFGGVNDNIAYGDSKSMWKYSLCVDNVVKICSSGVIFHPETLLKEHLKMCGVKITRFDFPYKLRKQ